MIISDITITYQNNEGLIRTLDSLIMQTRPFGLDYVLEIVVVDGGSNDGTLDTLELYSHKFANIDHIDFKYISEPDGGRYDAMNKGISIISGDWVLFLNAGDILCDNDIIPYFVEKLLYQEEYDIVYGNSIRDYGDDLVEIKPANLETIVKGLPFSHQSVFSRVNIFRDRPYCIDFEISSDYEWFLNAYQNGIRFKYISRAVSVFDTNGISANRLYQNYIEAEKIRSIHRVSDNFFIRICKRTVWHILDLLHINSRTIEKINMLLNSIHK